jgi:ribosomal protein L12E/L44/L45/RPP1/RPP2
MKHITVSLLAQAGGNATLAKADIISILEIVGLSVKDAQLSAVIEKLSGEDTAGLIVNDTAGN